MKIGISTSVLIFFAIMVLGQDYSTIKSKNQPAIWEKSSPEQHGISSKELNDMFDFVRSHHIPVHSVQILRHGKLVLDAYFYPYLGKSRHEVASVTKSITSTLVGIAIDKKYISSLTAPAFRYLPAYKISDSLKQTIWIEDLLTMRSGLDCGTNLSDPSINVDKRLMEARQCQNWIQCMVEIPMVDRPGYKFAYCNANCHLLSAILQNTTGRAMATFATEQLFHPLGIQDFYWPADSQGVNYGWADLQLHPYDMLKIGQLMLQGGKWGSTQVVPAEWLQSATRIHVTETGGSDKYGYFWWLPGGDYPDVFEAVGRGGQRITVWPSKDMVIVFTGGGFNTSALIPFIVKAIKADQPLPVNLAANETLKRNITAAVTPPQPRVIKEKPLIASWVENKQYNLDNNSLGFSAIQIKSLNEKEAVINLVWNGESVNCNAGFDGVPRFSLNPLVHLEQACSLQWKDDKSLEININMVGAINNYTLKCVFEDNAQKITIIASEGTGLNNEIIKGRINANPSLSQSINKQRKEILIGKVKQLITENFINADKAHIVADSLDVIAFSAVNTRSGFVTLLNQKLYYYTKDKHLSVEYNPNYAKELTRNKDDKVEQAAKEKREKYGFSDTEILPGNIGYLRLKYFSDTSNAKETAWQVLTTLKNTASLILDLRGNTGGSGSMVQLLCSFFIATENHPLLQIHYKQGNEFTLKTYPEIPTSIYKNPVFILCDQQTFSAAEAFTLVMKNRGRAKVIGDTTSGAGNIAGPYPLEDDYIITIPVGRIVDPITKSGWEGVGVSPDVNAGTSDALQIAMDMAEKKSKRSIF